MSQPAEKTEPHASKRFHRALYTLAVLGTLSMLWAAFLWRELIRARAGETPFCGFGESVDCGTLWSAAFATDIHHWTGMPVAGWGVVWSVVAVCLPLFALAFPDHRSRCAAACSGIDLTAGAGVAGVVVLLAASAAEGLFCKSCGVTYVLSLTYAVVAFLGLRHRPLPRSPHGVTVAVGLTAVAYLALLYPASRTPQSLIEQGQRALAEAGRQSRRSETSDDTAQPPTQPATPADRDAVLRNFLDGLPPAALQSLSDSLLIYRQSPYFEPRTPRLLKAGSAGAPVVITEFTDSLCGHCATLHQTMSYIETLVAPSSFALDARHYPLDGNCNPHIPTRHRDNVRCLAARAQICAEGTGSELSGAIFQHQRGLTADRVFDLASPFLSRAALEQCLASPETERKLQEDIEYAALYEPEGTPVVLINGRAGTWFGPFLYAMVLTGGDAGHPAFASLPPGRPPSHEGHNH